MTKDNNVLSFNYGKNNNKNKTAMKNKNKKSADTNTKRSPGRPKYTPVIPKSRFTVTDLCEANGVDLKTGKGERCSKLTLIKFLARDMYHRFESGKNAGKPNYDKPRSNSTVVLLEDIVAEPNSEAGLGRKSYVYQLRSKFEASNGNKAAAPKAKTPAPRKSAPKKTVAEANKTYEATKAAILAPVVAIAPAPAPVPEAPKAEVPAPVAAVTPPAPVPEATPAGVPTTCEA